MNDTVMASIGFLRSLKKPLTALADNPWRSETDMPQALKEPYARILSCGEHQPIFHLENIDISKDAANEVRSRRIMTACQP
jgi:hypothetical protein